MQAGNKGKLGKVAAALRRSDRQSPRPEDVSSLPTVFNEELCVKINNVETIVKQLAGLRKDLNARVRVSEGMGGGRAMDGRGMMIHESRVQISNKEEQGELNRIFVGIFSAVELRYNQIIAIITSHVLLFLLHLYSIVKKERIEWHNTRQMNDSINQAIHYLLEGGDRKEKKELKDLERQKRKDPSSECVLFFSFV